MVLGYPWFAATNPQIDWRQGLLPASVIVQTAGAASEVPATHTRVLGLKTATVTNQPILEDGEQLVIVNRKVTVTQQLAEKAQKKDTQTWDQIVPTQYHQYARVFSDEAARRFPPS